MTVVERGNSIAPPCDDGCEGEMIDGLLVLKLVGGNLCVLATVRLSSGVWEMGATCNLPSRLWEIITYRKRRRNWSEGRKLEAISKPQRGFKCHSDPNGVKEKNDIEPFDKLPSKGSGRTVETSTFKAMT